MDFHGERRSNQTHQSTTDPEARLYKKSTGSEAKLSYLGHVVMENRNGLLEAKFLDTGWLREFQQQEKQVNPGDAIKVKMKTIITYGYDGEIVGTQRFILEVLDIVRYTPPKGLFDA